MSLKKEKDVKTFKKRKLKIIVFNRWHIYDTIIENKTHK